jgi:Holliday junction resolvase RusA-like endonuclease
MIPHPTLTPDAYREHPSGFSVTLPIDPPRTTHQNKRLAIRNGRAVLFDHKNLRRASALYDSALLLCRAHKPAVPMTGAIRLVARFNFPTDAKKLRGTPKTTKPDLDNLCKGLLDALQRNGWIAADQEVAEIHAQKRWQATGTIEVSCEGVLLRNVPRMTAEWGSVK